MKLRILLAGLGLFALLSGWMKSRARVSERMGGNGLGVLEAGLGFLLVISQTSGAPSDGVRTGMGWATVAVMIASNAFALLRARQYAQGRRDSEGHRLYTRVKFEEALEKTEVDSAEPADSAGPSDAELPPPT
jgi:hypothetical protein